MKKHTALALASLPFALSSCGSISADSKTFSSSQAGIPEGYLPAEGMKQFEASQSDGIYNYCPSIIEDGDERDVYYCTNVLFNNVRDHIGYRHGKRINNVWYYSPEKIVIAPTEQAWDSVHCCDPSVIKGVFAYKGETYSYMMAYLGCVTTNCEDNEVGLAFAKEPQGPWIKPAECNRFVPYSHVAGYSGFQWGFGQASLVSVDKKGQVLLFYNIGTPIGSGTAVERWDFSDISAPVEDAQFKSKYDLKYSDNIPARGIMVNPRGLIYGGSKTDTITNSDFVFDETKNRFYFVGDGFPFPIESGDNDDPTFIATHLKIAYLPEDNSAASWKIGDVFLNQKPVIKWTKIKEIGIETTGKPRNHNAGAIKDVFGHAISSETFGVFTTISEVKKPALSLYTYRIWDVSFKIDDIYFA